MPYHDYDMIEGQLRPVADARCKGCKPALDYTVAGREAHQRLAEAGINPLGWDEIDGVKLPSVSPWAQLDQADLDKVHEIWRKR